jgi:hypothetical protein
VTGLDDFDARWYSPALGRFIRPDPFGFAAGDMNLYRFVGDNPLNAIDPSGMDELHYYGSSAAIAHGVAANSQPRYNPNQPTSTVQIGGPYLATLELYEFRQANDKRKATVAAYEAALQINKAYWALSNDWAEITQKFKFMAVPDAEKNNLIRERYRVISEHRQLYLERLAIVFTQLTSPATVIPVYDTNLTDPEKNPANTTYWRWDKAHPWINLRVHFWDPKVVDADRRTWTFVHEYARFFLYLDDNKDYPNKQGVENWDDTVEWLAKRYDDLHKTTK